MSVWRFLAVDEPHYRPVRIWLSCVFAVVALTVTIPLVLIALGVI